MPRHARPEEPAPDDDEFARLLADPEAFVRGGRHEPAARTRQAVARYGGEQSSWRQAAPLTATTATARRRRRSRPVLAFVLTVLVAAVAVGGVAWWRSDSGSGPVDVAVSPSVASAHAPIAADPTPTAVASTSTAPSVQGLSDSAPVGTCYTAPTEDSDLAAVTCDQAHDLELVAHELATGDDAAYPADDYWDGPVQRACYADAVAYLGGERSGWPAGTEPRYYRPTADSWQLGERGIECVVRTTPAGAGSLAGRAAPGAPASA